jgi:ssDNA-binding Zn-finger/Zn-ribbon topoisomerase 1
MKEDSKQDRSRVARTTGKFDRVLRRHVRRLLEVSDSDNLPPYSLNMIACLLVLAEREKELADFPGSPLKRYTRETFLKDLDEIGIDPDENVMVEIQNLTQAGYIAVTGNEEYQVRESATRLLSMLDAIFPTLPGLSLVAYILQAIEEVLSGRKEMILAIRQFDETLLTRGESVSKQRIDALRRQRVAASAVKRSDPALQKQRETYLEKLKAFRSKQRDQAADTAVVLSSGSTTKFEIREIFPKAPEPVEPEPEPEDSAIATTATLETIDIPPEPSEIMEPAAVPDAPGKTIGNEQTSPVDPPLEPVGNAIPSAGKENQEYDDDPQADAPIEDLIAKKIQAFEAQLAMTCPVCKEGKIRKDITEKGKAFYYCSNKACGLVSWGKPHHMACPFCENPFLIEFQQKDDGVGLKCPRATCSYQHLNFDGKTVSSPSGVAGSEAVRKVLVRKKTGAAPGTQRRVVRRKK